MTAILAIETEIRHGHLFCGIGGGAKGFNRGQARVGSARAKFRCVGGIDVDAASCRDFENGGFRGKDAGCEIDGREHKDFPEALAA